MAQKSDYQTKYKELEVIGRGNFGSATLVRSAQDNNIYVAKKVLLGGMNPKEAEGAKLEVSLLRDLKHPHIVEYKDSYVEDNMLIIIMEYCEEGDLTYFIKKRAQKNEFLDEKLVLNWFLQILLALEFVHRKKILHRDIKTSNIFLRSNGTVKLGDFGISKVLENTNEAALTVVGTPYYMSPEVCENKPYNFKSDVWALGCVLYEMCTLKHAFSANNLLGLVYKIVREQHEPISNTYSQQLAVLVQKLLIKNVAQRPSIREIFMEPLIRKTIEQFIQSDGQYTTMLKIPIKKTPLHNDMKKQSNDEESPHKSGYVSTDVSVNGPNSGGQSTMMSAVSNHPSQKKPYENETPQQSRLRRKEEQIREQEERMKNAARESLVARNQDKQRKSKELQGNMGMTNQRSELNKSASPTKSGMNATRGGDQGFQQQQYNSQYPQNSQSPLHGTSSNAHQRNPSFGNTRQSNDQNAKTLETLASLSNASAFGGHGQDREYQKMQKEFMDATNQSLSYSNSEASLTNKSGFNTIGTQNNQYANPYNTPQTYGGSHGNYGVKDNTGYSAYSIKTEFEYGTNTQVPQNRSNYYQDERPLPALKNKSAPLKDNNRYADEEIEEVYDSDEEEYAEDFEDYYSDEDDDKRLTVKATKKDMSEVMNLYKEKLNNAGNYGDFEDTTFETSISQPEQLAKSHKLTGLGYADQASNTRQTQIDLLITRSKQCLGPKLYEEAYRYLKKHREIGTPDKKIQDELGNIVGKRNLTHCFTIDQIIFLESSM